MLRASDNEPSTSTPDKGKKRKREDSSSKISSKDGIPAKKKGSFKKSQGDLDTDYTVPQKSVSSKRKITVKSRKAINLTQENPKLDTTTSSSKKKQKVQHFSSSEDDSDTEDQKVDPLDDDHSGIDKFETIDLKVNRFKKDVQYFNIDYLVIEEICLEGLDGITLEALCTRISVATEYPLPLYEGVMRFLWDIITSRNDIEFFALETPREKLVIPGQIETQKPNLGVHLESAETASDIYPFSPVKEVGVYGSAASYSTRVNISNEVRKLSLQEAEFKYGMRLIMVGTQKLRRKTLLNFKTHPNLELTDMEYTLLERIARSRKMGELTHGKGSLQVVSKNSKTLFYHRKSLLTNELITKQQFLLPTAEGRYILCVLLHLERFHNIRKTKSQLMIEQIVEVLKKRPFYRMDSAEARRIFKNRKSFKKLCRFQEFLKVVKIEQCRYRLKDLYPEKTLQQWKSKGVNCEKFVRSFELINPSNSNSGTWNEEESGDDSSDEDTSMELIFNRPLLYQVYMFINNGGSEGLSAAEIRTLSGSDFYSIRVALKILLQSNYICGMKIDSGRQRFIKYRCNHQELKKEEVREEEDEALDFISNMLDISKSNLVPKKFEDKSNVIENKTTGKFNLIKQLRKQSKPENQKMLDDIYKNNHDYSSSESTTQFDISFQRLDIFSNAQILPDNRIMHTHDNFKQVCMKIRELNIVEPCTFECNMVCPVDITEQVSNYRRLCSLVYKVVQPILVQTKYEVKFLKPRYRYQCKLQLAKEKLHELSQQKPELDEYMVAVNEQKGQEEFNYQLATKSAMLNVFMGPKPEIIYHDVDGNNIEVTVKASSKPSDFNETNSCYVRDIHVTLQTLKRIKHVLDAIQKEKIITDLISISKMLSEQNTEDGYKSRIDKKTVDRIYLRLVKAGLIKILHITIQSSNITKTSTVICDATYDLQSTVLESLIEQLKMKAFFSTATTQQPKPNDESHSNKIETGFGELDANTNTKPPYAQKRHVGRDYGIAPKFARLRTFHEFMFYLIYEFPKTSTPIVSNDDDSDMPSIYSLEENWKMFVPPLPRHKEWSDGWTLVGDLLVRLPLSLFVKICSISFIIPELNTLLEHPTQQHLLIKFLPQDIRNALLYKRKYIFTFHEIICRLCFMGLVQFGPQKMREKDQVFIYLNRYASLWDTTVSAPGYHHVQKREYRHIKYHFTNANAVDTYWYEMWNICMHTKLGVRQTVIGTYITIEHLVRKPSMIEAMQPKTPETASACDDGAVPGDKLGAAGLDSALWSHVKRNWTWGGPRKKYRTRKEAKSPLPERKLLKGKPSFVRHVLPRKDLKGSKSRAQDSIDKKLMLCLQQSRPEWIQVEDDILQICKIVILYVQAFAPRIFIRYTIIRDVLHKLCCDSTNKTSSAIRRRMLHILGTPDKQDLYKQIAKNLDCIPFVRKYFHSIPQNEKQAQGCFVFLTTYFVKHQHEMEHIFELLSGKMTTGDIPMNTEMLEIAAVTSQDNPRTTSLYFRLPKNFPQTEDNITQDTIQSIIHASLACHKNDTCWLVQLFWVYHKYPQNLLRQALLDLRTYHLTSGRRSIIRSQKVSDSYPVISKYLQFSHYYCYKQITKYPPDLFIETHEIFLGIWQKRDVKEIPMEGFKQGHTVGLSEISVYIDSYFNIEIPQEVLVLNPNINNHSELIRELAVRYKRMLTLVKSGTYFNDGDQTVFEKAKYGYRWPMIHRFLRSWFLSEDSEEIHDEVENININDTALLQNESTMLLQEEATQAKDGINIIHSENTDTSFEDYEKKLESFLSINDAPETTKEVVYKQALTSVDSTNVLQNYLSSFKKKAIQLPEITPENTTEPSEKVDERIQYLMNDELTVEQIMEEMLSDCPSEERKVPKPASLARLLVVGLFPELDEDEERLEKLYQHFLVICPETKFEVPVDFENNQMVNYLHNKHPEVCENLLKDIHSGSIISNTAPELNEVLENLKRKGATDVDVNLAEKLISFVRSKKLFGASVNELKKHYGRTENLSLGEILKTLSDSNVLIRTGITHFIYVHFDYQNPWVVKSCTLNDQDRLKLGEVNLETVNSPVYSLSSFESYQEVTIIVRPWVQIDGSINKDVLKKWLLVVLGHCLSHALLPMAQLMELCGFLKPVDIYYLLECLKTLGCLTLKTYSVPKCTLFSDVEYIEMIDSDITDNFDDIHIHSETLALIKLATLLNENQQCYSFSGNEPLQYESF